MLDGLFAFLHASPSPYHAVHEAGRLLIAAGFTELAAADDWAAALAAGGRGFTARGGALIAWAVPSAGTAVAPTTFRIVGAHTDSPNLRIKPTADVVSAGWRQLAVEVYGGALVNSWLDRDLGLSGRVVLADGSTRLVLVDRPLARVAQLAIHLDREVNDKGLVLDRQQHLTPVWGLERDDAPGFADWLAAELGVPAGDVLAWDLMLHDLCAPSLLGADAELIAAARLDNLFSCYCALQALCSTPPVDAIQVCALFDHEEVGSDSTTGAGGPFLEQVLQRLAAAHALDPWQAFAASLCVSADMAHAVHPNYADRHEPGHRPLPNSGPVLKINSNQRYATDAPTAARVRALCATEGIPLQTFVSRNTVPCGSTIGPITATRLGIPTVDIGCAQLSMHSARELAGADDAAHLVRLLSAVLAGR